MRKLSLILLFVSALLPAGALAASLASARISGTLPVMYINTTNKQPITSNETYVEATYYLDSLSLSGVHSIGSKTSPLPLLIRGRGNWTWTGFDKKPYRLKLEVGQKLLGMHKSKHWALMAGADDYLGFLKNIVGGMLSERLHLRWTPQLQPVEVVLNGDYIGLYFLTETIRIDNHRVDIVEQSDMQTDPDSITGGWLVELDNYSCEGQVRFMEPGWSGEEIRVTPHEPGQLSRQQYAYLESQMLAINSALYEPTSIHLEELIDMNEAARFYLVQEIMEDCESYHGSCYLYKDMGPDEKWFFGPVWDFGNSYDRHKERFIYDRPSFSQPWIGQLASFPVFQQHLQWAWYDFLHDEYPSLSDSISAFVNTIRSAAQNDGARWPQYSNADMTRKKQDFLNRLTWRVNWLRSQWGEGTADLEEVETKENIENARLDESLPMYNVLGQPVDSHYRGIILQNGRKYVNY